MQDLMPGSCASCLHSSILPGTSHVDVAGISPAAKRPQQDRKNASLKAGETTRKNQKEGPDRKGKNQAQDMKQETMGNQWAIEKVRMHFTGSAGLFCTTFRCNATCWLLGTFNLRCVA